jgi:hypothetical protein
MSAGLLIFMFSEANQRFYLKVDYELILIFALGIVFVTALSLLIVDTRSYKSSKIKNHIHEANIMVNEEIIKELKEIRSRLSRIEEYEVSIVKAMKKININSGLSTHSKEKKQDDRSLTSSVVKHLTNEVLEKKTKVKAINSMANSQTLTKVVMSSQLPSTQEKMKYLEEMRRCVDTLNSIRSILLELKSDLKFRANMKSSREAGSKD